MERHRRALALVAGCVLATSCAGSDGGPSSVATSSEPPADITQSAVQIIANGCSQVEVHGAGLMVAPGKVATVAHVVAGADSIEVHSIHGTSVATVVYIDPVLDVAVLKVDPALAAPIVIGTAVKGDQGRAIVYRDGTPVELPVAVQRLVDIRTADIHGEGTHIRPGYELTIEIQAGDSGAVVVVGDKAVALVWAVSRQAERRAWAMRTSLIADHLADDDEVDNGDCP